MSTRVRRSRPDAESEQDLLTGLVVSDEFCRRVLRALRPEHLKGAGTARLLDWIRGYFNRYEQAPRSEIQTIFNAERANLTEAEASNLDALLRVLSDRLAAEGRYNWAYQADRAIEYIRQRSLEILEEQLRVLRDRGETSRAEQAIREYGQVRERTSRIVQPLLDLELQHRSLERVDSGLFKLEGALGEVFGWWQRGWMVAFFGGTKRGKSWALAETAVQALVQSLKVFFISLEMNEEDMTLRWMRIASALPDRRGTVTVPVWDCAKNQDDSCGLPERENTEPIPVDTNDQPTYRADAPYRPCTFCKLNHDHLENYRPASWYKDVEKGERFLEGAIDRTASFARQYRGGNLWMECFPRFSAGIDDIVAALDEMMEDRGVIPDVLIVDYADILSDAHQTGREDWQAINDIWMRLSGLAQERHILVVSASQVNTGGLEARSLREKDSAGGASKIAHIDLGISINQVIRAGRGKRSERDQGVTRYGTMAKRHGAWPKEEVLVLQNLDLGQPIMDSFALSVGHRLLADQEE